MGWQYTVFAYPTLATAVVSAGLALYTAAHLRRHGSDTVRVVFLAVAAGLTIWTLFSALKLMRTDPAAKQLFYKCLYFGVAPLGPLSLLFALAYTDRDGWVRPAVAAALLAPTAVYVVLVFLNPYDVAVVGYDYLEASGVSVMRVETGPAHLLVMSVYAPVTAVVGVGIVVREAVRLGRAYLPQAALLTVALVAPLSFAALSGIEVPPFTYDGVNLVPMSAAVTVVAFGAATFRYRWFDLPPIAYTTVMEHSPDGVIVVDTTGRIVHANPAGTDVLDRLSAGINDPLDAAFPDVDPATASQTVFAFETGEGADWYLDVRTRPIERGGERVGTVLVAEDVTGRQQRRRELQAQKRRLDEFATVVSHDLRGPLTVASGNLEVLAEDLDAGEVETIRAAHERMEALIDDLLVLAREGERVDDPEPVALATVARESWGTTPAPDATFEVEVEADRRVVADRSRLRQLFGNLLRNAVDHAGADVTVRLGATDEGFYVEDDGPGVPAGERERVLESGYTTAADGTGLGLPIAARIADAHGWDLAVEAGADGGARFEVTGVEFESR